MIGRLAYIGVLCGILLSPVSVLPVAAQSSTGAALSSSPDTASATLQAVISGPQDIAVGRTIILDASLSRVVGGDVRYQWFIDDRPQPISSTVEAVYTPETPGIARFRLVLTAVTNGQTVTSEAEQSVTVYDRKIVLIADASVPADKLALHRDEAAQAGVFLRVLQPSQASTPLDAEEILAGLLVEESASFIGMSSLVVWTEGVTGLQALIRASQASEDILAGVRNQTIVVVTGRGLNTLARTAKGPFDALEPRRIVITRREAIPILLKSTSLDQFAGELDTRDIEVVTIDDSTAGLRPWNLLSTLVNSMLTRGVPSQTVILLLVLPVIATILAFFKQVVGITTFGLYTPSIIALSFLALGWKLGVFFLIFILLTGYATRAIMRRWRMLYIPKVAIILTVVSFTLLLLSGLSAVLGITLSRETVFILLIMSTLSESFLNLKTEQGLYSAVLGIGETVGASLLCVFIVQWDTFQSLILAYPELILLTILINVFLGRWTGLRLTEFLRFREVFKHLQEE